MSSLLLRVASVHAHACEYMCSICECACLGELCVHEQFPRVQLLHVWMTAYMYFQLSARHALHKILNSKNSSGYDYVEVPEAGGSYLVLEDL